MGYFFWGVGGGVFLLGSGGWGISFAFLPGFCIIFLGKKFSFFFFFFSNVKLLNLCGFTVWGGGGGGE